MHIGTIILLVGWLLIVTLRLWRAAGGGVALGVGLALSLLILAVWRYGPVDDWRRFQIAGIVGLVLSVVTYWI